MTDPTDPADAGSPRIRVWTMPMLLAASIVTGLFVALLVEAQPWRAIAWGLLAVPLAIGGLAFRRQDSTATTRRSDRRSSRSAG